MHFQQGSRSDRMFVHSQDCRRPSPKREDSACLLAGLGRGGAAERPFPGFQLTDSSASQEGSTRLSKGPFRPASWPAAALRTLRKSQPRWRDSMGAGPGRRQPPSIQQVPAAACRPAARSLNCAVLKATATVTATISGPMGPLLGSSEAGLIRLSCCAGRTASPTALLSDANERETGPLARAPGAFGTTALRSGEARHLVDSQTCLT